MKILSALLFGSSILLGHVAANSDALGFELVQFFYAYKLEYQSKIPEDERRLATICTKARGELCTFGGFLYLVLQDGPLRTYVKNNKAAFNTVSPDDTHSTAIKNLARHDERINASALSGTFPHNGGDVPYAKVVQDVTSVTEKAAAAGGIDKADVDSAVSNAREAKVIRESTSYKYVLDHMETAMGDGFKYLDHSETDKTFSWRNTLQKLKDARTADEITEEQFKEYKNTVRDASHGILKNAAPLDESHWAAAKSFSTFVSKGSAISTNLAAPPDTTTEPVEDGGPSCPSEFKGAEGAAKRRRHFLEPAMAMTGPSFQLGPRLSFDNGVMDMNVVPFY